MMEYSIYTGYFGLITVAILAMLLAARYRKQRNNYRRNCKCAEPDCKVPVSNVNNVNACQLINIARNGRMNVMTFTRAGSTFQIESMGILSDRPDEWRLLAGLDQR